MLARDGAAEARELVRSLAETIALAPEVNRFRVEVRRELAASGFLTSAAEAGASIWNLREGSRHKSLDTLRGYARCVDLFKEHAGAAFL